MKKLLKYPTAVKNKLIYLKKTPGRGEGEPGPEEFRSAAIIKISSVMASAPELKEVEGDVVDFINGIDLNYEPEDGEIGKYMLIVYILKFSNEELRQYMLNAHAFYKDSYNDWSFPQH